MQSGQTPDQTPPLISSPRFETQGGWSAGYALATEHGPGAVVGPGANNPNVFAQQFSMEAGAQLKVVARAASIDQPEAMASMQINWHGANGAYIANSRTLLKVSTAEKRFAQIVVPPSGTAYGVLYVVPGGPRDVIRYTEMTVSRADYLDLVVYRLAGFKHELGGAAALLLLALFYVGYRRRIAAIAGSLGQRVKRTFPLLATQWRGVSSASREPLAAGVIGSRYLLLLAAAAFLWLAAYLAFTWLVDPYGVSPLRVTREGINEYRPKRVDIDRLIKPYEVWRHQPKTVFLGTSRTHQAFDPSVLDQTPFAPAYNASIPASSLALNISHLEQYIALDPRLKIVIVELFFQNFLGQGQERAPKTFLEYAKNTASLFFTTDALSAAVQTLYYNRAGRGPVYEIKPGGYFYYPPGHDAQGTFAAFPWGIWQDHDKRKGVIKLYEPAFESFGEFIKVAREHGLELIFVLTPNHAYDDYYLDVVGAWPAVAEWLTRVSAAATVYSFSQPNSWVYEPVGKNMRYWNDPYHPSLEMGRAMELALAGKPDPWAPPDFMVRMTPDKVPEHVRSRQAAVRRFARDDLEFVRKFEEERRKWETRGASKKGG